MHAVLVLEDNTLSCDIWYIILENNILSQWEIYLNKHMLEVKTVEGKARRSVLIFSCCDNFCKWNIKVLIFSMSSHVSSLLLWRLLGKKSLNRRGFPYISATKHCTTEMPLDVSFPSWPPTKFQTEGRKERDLRPKCVIPQANTSCPSLWRNILRKAHILSYCASKNDWGHFNT